MNNRQHLIDKDCLIGQALTKINKISGENYLHVLFVQDERGVIIGAVTDGDIRRALIKGSRLDDTTGSVMCADFKFVTEQEDLIEKFRIFRSNEIFLVPVIDLHGKLVRLYDLKNTLSVLPLRALIMAGGKGERLLPLTKSTPKPMLTVGDKPILEHNIDRLIKFGIEKIDISTKYLSEQIESYFGDGANKDIHIQYILESKELGTAGSACLLQEFTEPALLLMNSDLLTNIDFERMYLEFKEKKADMIVATVPYTVNVPYAIMNVEVDVVKSFEEKPTYTYYSNAGIYILKNELVGLIPKNTFFDATDLMSEVISRGLKLISYPIRNYWLDIGKIEDYKRAQQDIKYIRL